MDTNWQTGNNPTNFFDKPKPAPQYAGFWLRFVAFLIDNIALGFFMAIVVTPLLRLLGYDLSFDMEYLNSEADSEEAMAALYDYLVMNMGIQFIVGWLYFAYMESSPNQATLGKMALSLKVTDLDGNKLDFAKATMRYFGKIGSALTLYIGFLMAAFTQKKQALHDIIAGALVVSKETQKNFSEPDI
ncbi:MAG TPA: RDD family protein [Chitinophagales bacterium]|nr:RDD family protein [Chitinophagales bacterium]